MSVSSRDSQPISLASCDSNSANAMAKAISHVNGSELDQIVWRSANSPSSRAWQP